MKKWFGFLTMTLILGLILAVFSLLGFGPAYAAYSAPAEGTAEREAAAPLMVGQQQATVIYLPLIFNDFSPQPTLSITPLSGPPGTELTVTGTGFPANTTLQVGPGVVGSEPVSTADVTTDDAGSFNTTVMIPDDAEIGSMWVVLARTADDAVSELSPEFEVAAEATITFTPTSGVAGTTLAVEGAGFPADALLDIGPALFGMDPDPADMTSVTADADGTFSELLTIPEDASVGSMWVVVAVIQDDAVRVVSTNTFEVTESMDLDL